MNKDEAQKRADRIRAFREEMAQVEQEQVLVLADDQKLRLSRYHDGTLADLASRFDVDTTEALRQMSLGMRIASLVGALALSAAVFLLFYRYWGGLGTAAQVSILIAAPLASLALMEWAARRDRTSYFAAILGLIGFACFVLNLSVLGTIFNITPTQHAFLIWSAFGFVLAYAYGLRILLLAGILAFMGWLSATAGTWGGCYWLNFGERPENFVLSGAVLFGAGTLRHGRHHDFPSLCRVFGLLAIFIPILVLSQWGEVSYLRLEPAGIEILYQLLGFLLAGAAAWIGIRMKWPEVTNAGSTFFVIFLYTKFFDWWWEWMPKWIFFLIQGAVAVALLVLLKRLRGMARWAES